MTNQAQINRLLCETHSMDVDPSDLYNKPIGETIRKVQTIVSQYGSESEFIKKELDASQYVVYRIVAAQGYLEPPFKYVDINTILFYLGKKEPTSADIDALREQLGVLISSGYIVTGTPEIPLDTDTLKPIKVSLSETGYRVKDPLINLYHYYLENKQMPSWLKGYLQPPKSKIPLDTYEQELVSRMPEAGYIMAPTSRKLTTDRGFGFGLLPREAQEIQMQVLNKLCIAER